MTDLIIIIHKNITLISIIDTLLIINYENMNLLQGTLANQFHPHIETLFVSSCFRKYMLKISESFHTMIQIMYYPDTQVQQEDSILIQDGHKLKTKKYDNFEALIRVLCLEKIMKSQKLYTFTNKLIGVDAIIFKNVYLSQEETLLRFQKLVQNASIFNIKNISMIVNGFMKLLNSWHDINLIHGCLNLQYLYLNKKLQPIILPSRFSQLIKQSIFQQTNVNNIELEFQKYLKAQYPSEQTINLYIHDELNLNNFLKNVKIKQQQNTTQENQTQKDYEIDIFITNQKSQTLTFRTIHQIVYLSFAFKQSYYEYLQFFKNQTNKQTISKQTKQMLLSYYNDIGSYENIKEFFQSQRNQQDQNKVLIHKVNGIQYFKIIPQFPALQWSEIILEHPQFYFNQQEKLVNHLQQYISLLKQINDPKIKFKLYYYQSKLFDYKGYLYRNFNLLTKMIKQFTDFSQRRWILNELGKVSAQLGENQRAEKYFLKCLQENTEKHGTYYLGNLPILINLTSLSLKIGKIHQIKCYAKKIKQLTLLYDKQTCKSLLYLQKVHLIFKITQQRNSQNTNTNKYQPIHHEKRFHHHQTIRQEVFEFIKGFTKQRLDLDYLNYLIKKIQCIDRPLFQKLFYCKALTDQKDCRNSYMVQLIEFHQSLGMLQQANLIRQDYLQMNKNDEDFLFRQYSKLAQKNLLQGYHMLEYANLCFKRQHYIQSQKYSLQFLSSKPPDKLSCEIAVKSYIKHHKYQQAKKLLKEKCFIYQSDEYYILCCYKLGQYDEVVKKWKQIKLKNIKIEDCQLYEYIAQSFLQLKNKQSICQSFIQDFQQFCKKQDIKFPSSFYQLKLAYCTQLTEKQKQKMVYQMIETNKDYYSQSFQQATQQFNTCNQLILAKNQKWIPLFQKIILNKYCIERWQELKKIIIKIKWQNNNFHLLYSIVQTIQSYYGSQSPQFVYTLNCLCQFYEQNDNQLKLLITLTKLIDIDKSYEQLRAKMIKIFQKRQIRQKIHNNNIKQLGQLKQWPWVKKIFKQYQRLLSRQESISALCRQLEDDFDVQKLVQVEDQIQIFESDCFQYFGLQNPLIRELKQLVNNINTIQ